MAAQTIQTYLLEELPAILGTSHTFPDLTLDQVQPRIFDPDYGSLTLATCNDLQILPLSYNEEDDVTIYAVSPYSRLVELKGPFYWGGGNMRFVLASAESIRTVLNTFPKTYIMVGEDTRNLSGLKLGEILLHQNRISEFALSLALDRQKEYATKHGIHVPLGRFLISENILSERDLAVVLGDQMQLNTPSFNDFFVSSETRAKIDIAFCQEHRVAPVVWDPKGTLLIVALADPSNAKTKGELGKMLSDYELRFVIASEDDMDNLLGLRNYAIDLSPILLLPNGIPLGTTYQSEFFAQYSGGVFSAKPLSEFHQAAISSVDVQFHLVTLFLVICLQYDKRIPTKVLLS